MPWLGYFLKMAVSDKFVFLDNVEFTRNSLTKRTYIQKSATNIEQKYLSVNVKKYGYHDPINALTIDHSSNWIDKAKNSISSSYRHTSFYKSHCEFIYQLLELGADFDNFSAYSMYCIKEVSRFLGINTDTYVSSSLNAEGKKSEYMINLVLQCNGTIYNSGMGAKKYQTTAEFSEANIDLRYLETYRFLTEINSVYPELHAGYSIIDNIFHLGKDNLIEIIDKYKKHYESIYREA